MTDNPALDPALVPEPPQLEPKRYRVVGTAAVFGHAPGEEFVATFDPQQEEFYTQYGHLAVVESAEATQPEGDMALGDTEQTEQTAEGKE